MRLTRHIGLATILMAASLPAWAQSVQTTGQEQTKDADIVSLEKYEVSENMEVFSDIALQEKTPISFTQIDKLKIAETLAGRDLPFVLQSSPSFYVTNQGGGTGDSNVRVRGFDQHNVAVLLNGVPVNDLENAWLYWSDLDSVGDVTSLIQLQRGISAVTIPSQSIGGTLNIITDPAAAKMGAILRYEAGSDGYFKQVYVLNSGLLKDKFAVSFAYSQKEGSGFTRGTWTRAQGYYLGASYQVNDNNRLELYAISAPQRHGQANYEQNIATFNAGLAAQVGYTATQIAAYPQQGMNYNQQYGPVSTGYAGQQYYNGGLHNRQNAYAINQAENYYNYPVANLNWFSTLSPDLKFDMVAYYIPGVGGGGGTLGSFPNSDKVTSVLPAAVAPYNWNTVIAANQSAANTDANGLHKSVGILRNNVNKQTQYGSIAKLTYDQNNWKYTAGIDWRWAQIDHYEEIRDLLGGDYYTPATTSYIYTYNPTTAAVTAVGSPAKLHLGDKVGYYYTNTIAWLGEFFQAQYTKGKWSGFFVASASQSNYKFDNRFVLNLDGSDHIINTPKYHGYQFKSGILYTINRNYSVYVNAGDVAKTPILSAAVSSFGYGRLSANATDEKFITEEAGVRFTTTDKKLTADLGVYHTLWNNHTTTSTNETANPPTITYNSGIDSAYTGVELESSYRPIKLVQLDVAASTGNWYYTQDGSYTTLNSLNGNVIVAPTPLSIKGVKVGNAPQTEMSLGLTVFPINGLSANLVGIWSERYWSNFAPDSRKNDWSQSWQVPNFNKYDLHVNYKIPTFNKHVELSVFAHVLNVFNRAYIQDAQDNYFFASSYPVGSQPAAHSAQLAEVYVGDPRTYMVGIKAAF